MAPSEYKEGLRIAVEGCGHGQLNAVYDSICYAQQKNNIAIDLLIVCGDFQAMRNMTDLEVMACPPKYRDLCDFHEYYSGKRMAPVLTIFIGGNHEASNYGAELFHGGWVAPNIYYLGASNVLQIGTLRVGGLSGIYKSHDYHKPRNETLPYYPNEIRSIYHIRSYDVFKLFQIQNPMDIMLSHDWPANIEHYGDIQSLFKAKPWFISDSQKGELGSPPAESLLRKLKPKYWFSGHMHVKFSAMVKHDGAEVPGVRGGVAVPDNNPDELDLDLDDTIEETPQVPAGSKNSEEIALDLDDALATAAPPSAPAPQSPDELGLDLSEDGGVPVQTTSENLDGLDSSPSHPRCTRFLALDKCLPNRDFLQILTVPFTTPLPPGRSRASLNYDPEYLAITRFANLYPANSPTSMESLKQLSPPEITAAIARERDWVEANVVSKGKLEIPTNFVQTAPVHTPGQAVRGQPKPYANAQTVKFCEMLEMDDWVSQNDEVWENKKKRLESHPPNFRGGRRGGRGKNY